MYGGYTYLDGEVVSAADGTQGHTPANTPRNTVTLWTTYEPIHNWQIGGGMTYLSARYASNTNFVEVGGYTRWDATVAFLQPKYDLRLNLLNLTNRMYYGRADPVGRRPRGARCRPDGAVDGDLPVLMPSAGNECGCPKC